MKKFPLSFSRIVLALTLLAVAGLLSACGGQVLETWPGLSVDDSGGLVYLAAGPHVYAVDAATGTEKSRTPQTAGKITFYTPPAFADDGNLLLGSYNHSFYKMAPNANDPVWTFAEATDRYVAKPLVVGDTILAPNGDGKLYALSLDGQKKWAFAAGHGLWGSPVVSDATVFFASMDHHVYAVNLADGGLVWTSEDLGGAMVARLAFDEATLYVGTFGSKNDKPSESSKIVAVNAADGSVKWSVPVKGWVWSTPALVDGVLYFGDQEGILYALNAADGSQVWQTQVETTDTRNILASPLVTQDVIYIVNKSGALYAFDRADGSQKWMKAVGGSIYSTPVLAGDLIVVAPMNFDFQLVAFDTAGNQKWQYAPAK